MYSSRRGEGVASSRLLHFFTSASGARGSGYGPPRGTPGTDTPRFRSGACCGTRMMRGYRNDVCVRNYILKSISIFCVSVFIRESSWFLRRCDFVIFTGLCLRRETHLMLLKMARLSPLSPLLPTTSKSTSWFLTSQHRLNRTGVSTRRQGPLFFDSVVNRFFL
jgi:hypothetical protein